MIASVVAAGECHVWWADPRLESIDTLVRDLSANELRRAARFRREPDRRRFLTGAHLLREAAAERLGVRPADVVVDRTCPDCDRYHGKPRVLTEGETLHVSISHSGDRVAVALTAVGPLGVDVEAVPATPVDDLARCALTETERQALVALPEHARYEGFARIWVRKEAALKATGHGLRISPDRVEVTGPGESPALLSWPLDVPPAAVRIHPLDPGPGYVAVVAVLGGDHGITVREADAALLRRRDGFATAPQAA
ncbi:4'-phosphopantetheinyl transferase superfamily protein [Microbispora sp. NPDC049633]|uniref:4'-phosphopantetheinyl transferase family protein n=1 Tax=Microbispora sp. NPDC049633 TaxID=3154355 RepID=UPI00342296F6